MTKIISIIEEPPIVLFHDDPIDRPSTPEPIIRSDTPEWGQIGGN